MKLFKELVLGEGTKAEYQKFFNDKLKKFDVKIVSELSDEDKKNFFNEIDKEWECENEED